MAGKRLGKEDERHLWPEMLRAIKEIQPRWVVGENVYGLVNWSGGLVFHEVQTDLEAAGYEVFPYVLPACSVNAPHRRDRVWFVAKNTFSNGCIFGEFEQKRTKVRKFGNTCTRDTNGICLSKRNAPHANGNGFNQCDCKHEINTSEGGSMQRNIKPMGEYNAADSKSKSSRGELQQRQGKGEFGGCDSEEYAADTNGSRVSRQPIDTGASENIRQRRSGFEKIRNFEYPGNWQEFPTQSPVRFGDDGLSSRLDGITFSKWRNESIKAAGNAIVPQVVYQIFKAIQEYEKINNQFYV